MSWLCKWFCKEDKSEVKSERPITIVLEGKLNKVEGGKYFNTLAFENRKDGGIGCIYLHHLTSKQKRILGANIDTKFRITVEAIEEDE